MPYNLGMSEKCSHNHDHSHKHEQYDNAFKWAISLNLIFVVIEAYYGFFANSLALLSDALHNFSDVVGLVLVWFAFWLSNKVKTERYSFIAAFINASLLILSCLLIIYEAYERYQLNQPPNGVSVIIVAAIGIVINFFTAQKFHHHHHDDVNIKSAYLHLMADAAISAGVMVTGVVILFYPLYWLDSVISAIISLIILVPASKLIKQSFDKIRAS